MRGYDANGWPIRSKTVTKGDMLSKLSSAQSSGELLSFCTNTEAAEMLFQAVSPKKAPQKKVAFCQVGLPPAFPYTLNVGYADGSVALVEISKRAALALIAAGLPSEG